MTIMKPTTKEARAREVLGRHRIVEGFSKPLEAGYVAVVDPDAIIAAMLEFAADVGPGWREGVEDAARYVEGHGGVIPGSTVFVSLITGDRMPCMSGDGRDKMTPSKRRYFDDATRDLAAGIRSLSAAPAPDAKEEG